MPARGYKKFSDWRFFLRRIFRDIYAIKDAVLFLLYFKVASKCVQECREHFSCFNTLPLQPLVDLIRLREVLQIARWAIQDRAHSFLGWFRKWAIQDRAHSFLGWFRKLVFACGLESKIILLKFTSIFFFVKLAISITMVLLFTPRLKFF